MQVYNMYKFLQGKSFGLSELFCSNVCLLSNVHNTGRSSVTFKPKKALLLGKITKYESEKSLAADLTDAQLKYQILRKGLSVEHLIARSELHHEYLSKLESILKQRGLEVCLVNRFSYTPDAIDWADVIFTGGGDGTFLLGASQIVERNKPLIGFNTDPHYSQGYLCLPVWCTTNMAKAVDLILAGQFRWLFRQRLNASLTHPINMPVSIQSMSKLKPTDADCPSYSLPHSVTFEETPVNAERFKAFENCRFDQMITTHLPIYALNEIYFGDALSACVSFYDLSLDGAKAERHKSSGIVVATGTGSTSWFQHCSTLTADTVQQLFAVSAHLTNSESDKSAGNMPKFDRNPMDVHSEGPLKPHPFSLTDNQYLRSMASQIAKAFNTSLVFNPEDSKMAYVVRDPLCNTVFSVHHSRGFATNILIRSLMIDAQLVFDGGLSVEFPQGSIVEITTRPSNALLCIQLEENPS